MKSNKELLKIWNRCEETRRMETEAIINFEALDHDEKARIFDLIKERKHLK